MIPKFDEASIVDASALSKEHFDLVEKLKRALIAGQSQFLAAGKYLYEIKEQGTYKYEDASSETTWDEFVQRPDIPIPGRTPDSRTRMAYTLVKIYKTFKVNHPVEDSRLAEIGWTKLDILASYVEKNPDSLDEMLNSAKELTTVDLRNSLGSGSLKEDLNCTHDHQKVMHITKCTDCNTVIDRKYDD